MRSLLQVALLDVASLVVGIVALALSSLVGFIMWRIYRAFNGMLAGVPGLLGSVASLTEQTEADWGAKGGLNRAANMQAAKMLSTIERSIFDSQIPFAKQIRWLAEKLELPLDDWIDEMPFGIISLLQNPKAQKFLGPLQGTLGQLIAPPQQEAPPAVQRAY